MKFSDNRGDDRNRDERPRSILQTPFLFPFFLLCLGLSLWAVGGGCSATSTMDSDEAAKTINLEVVNRAVEAMKKGETGIASGYINQAVRDGGDSAIAATMVGAQLIRLGRPADAAQFLQDWGTRRPEAAWDPLFYVTLGMAHRSVGDFAAASAADASALARAETIMKDMGKLQPTTSSLGMLKIREAAIRFMRVGEYFTSYQGAFDFKRGLSALREADRIAPNNPSILNQLGYTLADKGSTKVEFTEAVQLTKRAVDMAPENGMILDSYGWALYKLNDFQGARRVLRQAVDRSPDEPEIHYHLGVVYAELDMKREALLEFERALVLSPGYGPALQEKLRLSGVPSPL